MKPEQHKSSIFFGNERRTFVRIPDTTLELNLLHEQEFRTTCQEIADLYNMLQHKCIQVDHVHEFKNNPVTMVQTHGGDHHRKVIG